MSFKNQTIAMSGLLLAIAAIAANAQQAPTQKIEIVGKAPDETETRRLSTAPTMVFGREELDRHGDSNVVEVLKRLPGVTMSGRPGRGSGVQMRGMGSGYTQILINGEPAPRGMSLDSFTPDQVERIEVTRSATAEHSARAVAGTINIVLREDVRKLQSEVRLSMESEAGRLAPSVMAQHSDRTDTLNYTLSANLGQADRIDWQTTLTEAHDPHSGLPLLAQRETSEATSRAQRANLSGRINQRLVGGGTLNLQTFLMASERSGTALRALQQDVGLQAQEWASANSRSSGDSQVARVFGDWQGRLGPGRASMRISAGGIDESSDSTRLEADAAGQPGRRLDTDSAFRDRSLATAGKYVWSLGEGHGITGGWELDVGHRTEQAHTLQNGVVQLLQEGDTFIADTRRVAIYLQDDWEISPQWSAYAGFRGEDIHTSVDALNFNSETPSRVWSPMLHSLWKLDDARRTQLRMSLARTYRAPSLGDLIARPRPNMSFAIDAANDSMHPDRIGNPALKPELAWGLDTAIEHFPESGGLLSANVFVRSIDDLMRNVTAQRTVSWSSQPRWVTRPENLGHALSYGIEIEAKFRLDRWLAEAPPVDLRANFSRFWSRVDVVPGPDNRLDQQPTATANLGADYRLKSLPLTVGGNLNWTPAYQLRRLDSELTYQGSKRIVEGYVLWAINPVTKLRLGAANMLHEDYVTATRQMRADIDQTATVIAESRIAWTARLELKL